MPDQTREPETEKQPVKVQELSGVAGKAARELMELSKISYRNSGISEKGEKEQKGQEGQTRETVLRNDNRETELDSKPIGTVPQDTQALASSVPPITLAADTVPAMRKESRFQTARAQQSMAQYLAAQIEKLRTNNLPPDPEMLKSIMDALNRMTDIALTVEWQDKLATAIKSRPS